MAESKRFLLRLPPEAYEALEKWAQDDLRSVNAQIGFLLISALKKQGRMKSNSPKDEEPEPSDSE